MLRNTKITIAGALLILGSFAAVAAQKMNTETDTLAAIKDARISLMQAIAVAEQHTGGKAMAAEYEKTKNGWAFDIEVVVTDKVFDVLVDANYGNIISSTEDQVDQDDENDENDNED